MAIKYGTPNSENDLLQILDLQLNNHVSVVTGEQSSREGFVTVRHSLPVLTEMNKAAPQIIAKDDDMLAGYALVMLRSFEDIIPVLKPMFEMFSTISYKGKLVNAWNYYVMGQICVAEGYRGMGIFDGLYQKHKELYQPSFELCITEVSARNKRSMRAHERVGFKTIHTFQDATDHWNIMAWDWQK